MICIDKYYTYLEWSRVIYHLNARSTLFFLYNHPHPLVNREFLKAIIGIHINMNRKHKTYRLWLPRCFNEYLLHVLRPQGFLDWYYNLKTQTQPWAAKANMSRDHRRLLGRIPVGGSLQSRVELRQSRGSLPSKIWTQSILPARDFLPRRSAFELLSKWKAWCAWYTIYLAKITEFQFDKAMCRYVQ